MTAPELKPCPFCGGEASLITGDECAYVQCLDVKMHRGPFIDGDNDAVSEAAAAWNRRADLAAAIEPQPDPRTADYEQAYQYALTLADALIAKHYPDNKDWRPLGDLTGLLTQIDNMVAGKKPDPRDAVPAQARVKPLVWYKENERCWSASWGFATYSAYLRDNGQYSMRMSWSLLMTDGYFDTLEAAKAAAQADYESRVLAGLEPQPDPRDAVIARLVEAAQVCVNTFITSTEHSNLRAAIAAAKAVQHG